MLQFDCCEVWLMALKAIVGMVRDFMDQHAFGLPVASSTYLLTRGGFPVSAVAE